VRALAEAAQAGDRAEVWRLVGPATRARLTADARAAAQLAERRALEPVDLIAAGWFAPRAQPVEFRELTVEGDHATVEVRGARGEREQVACTRVGAAWRVELP
jgi:hypothetical protein